mmetsp:Transcript_25649/g.59817  ORF Transcript_25649/g.59817 Transcript_25649/m.59817 type:complete len:585 (-) Transcript_25649:918-2672(-)
MSNSNSLLALPSRRLVPPAPAAAPRSSAPRSSLRDARARHSSSTALPSAAEAAATMAIAPRTASVRRGAAEEPVDYSAYQTHPSERPGYDPSVAVVKIKTPASGTGSPNAKGHAGTNGAADPTDRCSNCGRGGASVRCDRGCGTARYCTQQTVDDEGERVYACQHEHWLCGGHAKACRAALLANTVRAREARKRDLAIEAGDCTICLSVPVNPLVLPCGHSFCEQCVNGVREKGVSEVCPLCRASLPPGNERLFENGFRLYSRVDARVRKGEVSWVELPPADRDLMQEAMLLLAEAADQGHAYAQQVLGEVYYFGEGVPVDFERALEFFVAAGHQGLPGSQLNVGIAFRDGLGCEQSHERAVEWLSKVAMLGPEAEGAVKTSENDADPVFHNMSPVWQATYELGLAYALGEGVVQNHQTAFGLCQRAAVGHSDAYTTLLTCYMNGIGVSQSWGQAKTMYDAAAKHGHTVRIPFMSQLESVCPLLHRSVVLVGLPTELGGRRGTTVDFACPIADGVCMPEDGQYTVVLDDGQTVEASPSHVVERDEWTDAVADSGDASGGGGGRGGGSGGRRKGGGKKRRGKGKR